MFKNEMEDEEREEREEREQKEDDSEDNDKDDEIKYVNDTSPDIFIEKVDGSLSSSDKKNEEGD